MSENQKKKSNKKVVAVAIALCLLLMICGGVGYVIAAMNATLNIGGNISFSTAGNIYATISAGTVSGNATTDTTTGKMESLTYNVTGNTGDATTWSGLSLNFNDNGDDVTITFTVTNNSTENDLVLTVGDITGDYSNVDKTVKVGGEQKTATDTVTLTKVTEGASTNVTTVTITFKIQDKNVTATASNFGFAFTLANAVGA